MIITTGPYIRNNKNIASCQLTFLIHTLSELWSSNMQVTGGTQVTHITSHWTARVCLKHYNRSWAVQAPIFYVDSVTNTWQFASCNVLAAVWVREHNIAAGTWRRVTRCSVPGVSRPLVVLSSRVWRMTMKSFRPLKMRLLWCLETSWT